MNWLRVRGRAAARPYRKGAFLFPDGVAGFVVLFLIVTGRFCFLA